MKIRFLLIALSLTSTLCGLSSCSEDTQESPDNKIELHENMTDTLIRTYAAQWNVSSGDDRLDVLRQIWADDGRFIDPFGHSGEGPEYLNSVIENDQQQNQGVTFSIEDVFVFEKTGFWTWRMFDENQQQIIWGYDFAEIDEEGRIKLLVTFAY